MAIAFVSAGAGTAGTTSLSVAFPASLVSGNLLVLVVGNKYPANGPATPSGWTLNLGAQTFGGSGGSGADTGSVFITVFTKVSDGTETGTQTVTIASGNSAIGVMFQYGVTAGSTWIQAATNGTDVSAGTSWSITTATDPGIVTNDMVLACTATNTDAYTYSTEACACTGVTFGTMTERGDAGTTQGDDCAIFISEHPVTAGPSSSTLTYTATSSGTAANNPCGATVILKLREVNNYTFTADVTTYAEAGQDATLAVERGFAVSVGEFIVEMETANVEIPATPSGNAPTTLNFGPAPRAYVRHASSKSKWPWQKRPKGLFRGH